MLGKIKQLWRNGGPDTPIDYYNETVQPETDDAPVCSALKWALDALYSQVRELEDQGLHIEFVIISVALERALLEAKCDTEAELGFTYILAPNTCDNTVFRISPIAIAKHRFQTAGR